MNQALDTEEATRLIDSLPSYCGWAGGWCKYEGEPCVAQANYQDTVAQGQPMIDLFADERNALNYALNSTVPYQKTKFSRL